MVKCDDMGCLTGNDERYKKAPIQKASAFAQQVLAHVGGSLVYIEPKKVNSKMIDTDKVE